jgi:hypothetical protein
MNKTRKSPSKSSRKSSMCKNQPTTREGLIKEFICYQKKLQKMKKIKSNGSINDRLKMMSKELLKFSLANIKNIYNSETSKRSKRSKQSKRSKRSKKVNRSRK